MEINPVHRCAERLGRNGFTVEICTDTATAGKWIAAEITRLNPGSIAFGDSMTLYATGTIDRLRNQRDIPLIDGFEKGVPRPELLERRRQGLLADLFLTGINAVTLQGTLHWLDMIGNRIAPVAYGPRHVILVAGRNKIVATEEDALCRIREVAAPRNAARHAGFRTPCIKTGRCMDCNSPDRICNARLTLLKCFPKGRITVVLIDEDLGL